MVAPIILVAAGWIMAAIGQEIVKPVLSDVFAGVLPVEELGVRGTALSEYVQGTITDAMLLESLRKSNLKPDIQKALYDAAVKEKALKLAPTPIGPVQFAQTPAEYLTPGVSQEQAYKAWQADVKTKETEEIETQEKIRTTGLTGKETGDISYLQGQEMQDYVRLLNELAKHPDRFTEEYKAKISEIEATRTAGGRAKTMATAEEKSRQIAEEQKKNPPLTAGKMLEKTEMAQQAVKKIPSLVGEGYTKILTDAEKQKQFDELVKKSKKKQVV